MNMWHREWMWGGKYTVVKVVVGSEGSAASSKQQSHLSVILDGHDQREEENKECFGVAISSSSKQSEGQLNVWCACSLLHAGS